MKSNNSHLRLRAWKRVDIYLKGEMVLKARHTSAPLQDDWRIITPQILILVQGYETSSESESRSQFFQLLGGRSS